MRPRTSLSTLAILAVGALLGYAAASGQFNSIGLAQAGTPINSTGTVTEEPHSKGLLLAISDDFEARQQDSGQPAKDRRKPNILVIMGDDIGWFNVSDYNHGIMGYQTPNIDRIAREGAMFTDWYGQ